MRTKKMPQPILILLKNNIATHFLKPLKVMHVPVEPVSPTRTWALRIHLTHIMEQEKYDHLSSD